MNTWNTILVKCLQIHKCLKGRVGVKEVKNIVTNTKKSYMAAKKSDNTSGHGRSKFSSSPMYKFWDDQLSASPRVTGHGVVDSGTVTGEVLL